MRRSAEVSECTVCGGRTNLVEQELPLYTSRSKKLMLGGRDWTVCPNAESCWHHELEAKLQWLRFPHLESTRRALIREINRIRKDPRTLIMNDIKEINPETTPTRCVDVTFARRPDAALIRCTHHRDRDGQIVTATDAPVGPQIR